MGEKRHEFRSSSAVGTAATTVVWLRTGWLVTHVVHLWDQGVSTSVHSVIVPDELHETHPGYFILYHDMEQVA